MLEVAQIGALWRKQAGLLHLPLIGQIARLAALSGGTVWRKLTGRFSGFEMFGGNGLLDYDLIATDGDDMRIDVHRCTHAELMKELGGEEIGAILLCGEDHVMAARAGNRLERPATIMQGASSCGFRYLPGRDAE